MEDRYFTAAEAQTLVGQGIRTNVEFSGVPQGTTGSVSRADEGADSGHTVGFARTQRTDKSRPLFSAISDYRLSLIQQ